MDGTEGQETMAMNRPRLGEFSSLSRERAEERAGFCAGLPYVIPRHAAPRDRAADPGA